MKYIHTYNEFKRGAKIKLAEDPDKMIPSSCLHQPFFYTIIFILLSFISCDESVNQCSGTSEEPCQSSSQDSSHNKNIYSEDANLNLKWHGYYKDIEEAQKNYKPCVIPDKECKCHENVIKSDLARWSKHGINKDVIDQAKHYGTHYQIIDHVLYRGESCMFPARCSGVEHFIQEIIEDLPNMEFILNTRDYPQSSRYHNVLPIFSFSKTKDYIDITYPAWTFWEGGPAITLYPTGLGRWDKHRISIPKAARKWPWHEKTPVAFFRGSRTTAERDPLILLSRKDPSLVDAQYTKNQAWKSDQDTLGAPPASEIPLEDHCHYKYLFNFRGVAASFRFKHLFLCRSLVFHVGDDWGEFFYSQMKPWVHYIPVSSQLTEVRELLEFVKENDETAQDIAYRGYEYIWNHLRMEDVSCYWKKLLTEYAATLNYKVKKSDAVKRVH
ncbi:O-glucosyltransferase rumi [Nymphon striatum]|nr:O-glucosyltransferase rumi [Nymphon striatum]